MAVKINRICFMSIYGKFMTGKKVNTEYDKCELCVIPKIEAELRESGQFGDYTPCQELHDPPCEAGEYIKIESGYDEFVFRLASDYEINYYMGFLAGKAAEQIKNNAIIAKVKALMDRGKAAKKSSAPKINRTLQIK